MTQLKNEFEVFMMKFAKQLSIGVSKVFKEDWSPQYLAHNLSKMLKNTSSNILVLADSVLENMASTILNNESVQNATNFVENSLSNVAGLMNHEGN